MDPRGLDYCATPIWDDQGNLIGYDPNSCVPDNQYYGQFGYAYVEPQIVNPGAPPTSNSGFWTSLMGSWLVGTMTPSPSWAPNPSYRGGVIRSAPPTTTQVGPNLTPPTPQPQPISYWESVGLRLSCWAGNPPDSVLPRGSPQSPPQGSTNSPGEPTQLDVLPYLASVAACLANVWHWYYTP